MWVPCNSQWGGGHVGPPFGSVPLSAPLWPPQVGEDVPDARKCACASHVAKIAEFFQVGDNGDGGGGDQGARGDGRGGGVSDVSRPQGVDVIVNASSVEDIDPGAIGQRLSNGLARVSSPVLHRLRLREDENAEPVVMSPRWWHHPAGQARLCLPRPAAPRAAYSYSPRWSQPPPLTLLRPRARATRKPTPPWR